MSQITDINGMPLLAPGDAVSPLNTAGRSSTSVTSVIDKGNNLPQQPQKAAKVGQAEVNRAVLQVNNYLQSQNRTLEFSVDKSTGRAIIKVVDQSTGKVLRQIPPEYMIRLAQTLQQDSGMSSTGIKLKT